MYSRCHKDNNIVKSVLVCALVNAEILFFIFVLHLKYILEFKSRFVDMIFCSFEPKTHLKYILEFKSRFVDMIFCSFEPKISSKKAILFSSA